MIVMMRYCGAFNVGLCAFAAAAVMAMSACLTPALAAPSPTVAWDIRSVAQPTNFSAGDLQEERLFIGVSATGGSFTLAAEGETTTPIAWDATPGEVQSALDALSSIGGVGGSVTVTGGPGDAEAIHPYVIAVGGSLAGKNFTSFTASETSLTGGRESVEKTEEKGFFLDDYTLTLTNVGSEVSSGPTTIIDELPSGITTTATPTYGKGGAPVCTPTGAGQRVLTCTLSSAIKVSPLHETGQAIFVPVHVEPGASAEPNRVQVSGGGAPACGGGSPPCAEGLALTSLNSLTPPFGLLDSSASAWDGAGALETQAGGHPTSLTTSFDFPSAKALEASSTIDAFPVEDVKQIVVDLPVGFIGDAQAAPTCSLTELTHVEETGPKAGLPACASDTQVGVLGLVEPHINGPGAETDLPIYNVTPEQGYPAEFGVYNKILTRAVLLYASVRSDSDYGVRVMSQPIPQALPINGVSSTFFGDPAVIDKSDNPTVAFFTNPSDCSQAGFQATIHVDSWQHPGTFNPDGTPNLNDPSWKTSEQPAELLPKVENCAALQFINLKLAVTPDTSQADEPSGYGIDLTVPQNEDPNGPATPPLKNAVVTLPAGVSISPSAADGLVGCQAEGSEGINLTSDERGDCPLKSTVGSVKVITPLLKEPLEGSVYVGQPTCGGAGQPECTEVDAETGKVFALYLEVEGSGVHIKLSGTIEVGGNGEYSRTHGLQPGQVRTTFANDPQQPFSELKLHLNGGPRAPLASPQTCGSFTTTSDLTPWSSPETPDATPLSSFEGTGCEGWPFKPSFSAGTVSPQAGAYSPFSLTFSRHDREQDLSGVTVNMPQGLLGKIAGIPQCPEAEANAGTCSTASQIGTATAAAGAGSHPFWQSGQVFLTGPYKGAPFGLSVVVPAVAGPYNLGLIVVRAAIYVNPDTSALTVVSNPLPQSIDGVPLRVQTINVTVNREGFMFNPTSCEPLQVGATLGGLQGASVNVASAFATTGCRNLPFRPALSASTVGKTSKLDGASLGLKIVYPAGVEANIAKVDVEIPKLLPSRLTTLQKACTEAQFNANPAGCPAASNIAGAVVHTPLLNSPLVGPAYIVSHGNEAFPDVELVLQGEGVLLVVDGKTQIKNGITYSHFETVPDAPFTTFEFNSPQGRYSLFGAPSGVCGKNLVMPVTLTAQNGAVLKQNTKIAITGCPKSKPSVMVKKAKAKGSSAVLVTVVTSERGSVTVSGHGLKSTKKTLAAGTHRIKVPLNSVGKTARKRHGKTKVKISLKGAGGSASRTITLKL